MLTWLRNRALMAVTLGHFSVDMYSGMLPLILVALGDSLSLSYAQIGLVSSAFTLTSSLTQPFFGWLADRLEGRALAAGGVITIAVMMGLMRLAPSYEMLLVLAPLAGLGSAAFHPQGAANASLASGARRATGMSIFMLGGNSGFSTGPIVARAVFATAGQAAVMVLTGMGVLLGLLQLVVAAPRRAIDTIDGGTTAAHSTYRPSTRQAAFALIMVIFLGMWVRSSLTTYIPQWVRAQGYSIETASNLLFVYLLPIAIGGLIGGALADRIGRKPVIVWSMALQIPLILILLASSGRSTFIVAPILGLISGASFPITLVMAQELLPRGIGVMSGLVLGFTFISGGIGVAISGLLADRIGLVPMLTGLAFIQAAGVGFALLLPRRERRITDTGITQAADAAPAEV